MDFFRKYLSRRQCFLLLNTTLVLGLALTDRLIFTFQSIVIAIVVLGVINFCAYLSLRYYPDWK
jgi:hypothetical protein